jgi:hypothetical protein
MNTEPNIIEIEKNFKIKLIKQANVDKVTPSFSASN